MKYQYLIVFFLLYGFVNKADNSNIIQKVFTKNEDQQILEIVSLVDSLVLSKTNHSNLKEAYYSFLVNVMEPQIIDSINNNYKPIEEIVFVIQEKEIFNEIWIPVTLLNYSRGKEFETLYFDKGAKYLKFLRKLGNQIPLLKKYSENTNFVWIFARQMLGGFFIILIV